MDGKKIGIIAGGSVATLIAVALVAPSFVDWNKYKPELIAQAEAASGAKIRVDGELSFRVLPMPALSIAKLSVADPARPEVALAAMEALDVRVALLPLLTGKVEVASIRLDKPVIHLAKDAAGKGNWEFLLKEKKQDEEKSDVSIGLIKVSDGLLTYADAQTKQSFEIKQFDAAVAAKSGDGPIEAETEFKYRDVPVELALKAGAADQAQSRDYKLKLKLGDGTASLESEGKATLAENWAASGKFDFEAGNVAELLHRVGQLQGKKIDAKESLAVKLGLSGDFSASPIAASLKNGNFAFADGKGTGTVDARLGEKPAARINGQVDSLAVEPLMDLKAAFDDGSAYSTPGGFDLGFAFKAQKAAYKKDAVRNLSLAGRSVGSAITLSELKGELPGQGNFALTGVYDGGAANAPFDGNLNVKGQSLAALLDWLEMKPKDMPEKSLQAYAASGKVHADAKAAALENAMIRLDQSTFRGALAGGFGTPQTFVVDGTLDRINLDAYSPPAKAEKDTKAVPPRQALKEALAPLAGYNGRVKLVAGTITARGGEVRNLTVDVGLAPDAITLNNVGTPDFRGAGGKIGGAIRNLKGDPQLDLALDVKSANLKPLLAWAGIAPPLPDAGLKNLSATGRIAGNPDNVTVDLSGTALTGRYKVAGPLDLTGNSVAFRNLTFGLTAPTHRGVHDALGMEFGMAEDPGTLDISGTATGTPEKLHAEVNGKLLAGTGKLKVDLADAEGGKKYAVDINFTSPSAEKTIKAVSLGLNEAAKPQGGLEITTRLTGDSKNVDIPKFKAKVAGATVNGSFTARNIDARPALTAKIDFSHFVVDQFKAPTATGAEAAAAGQAARWSSEPFRVEGLRQFDMQLNATGRKITYGPWVLTEPTVALTLKDGILKVVPIGAGLFGGKTRIETTLDARGTPKLDGTVTADGVALNQLTKAAAAMQPLTGKGRLKVDFHAAGASQLALVQSLSGNATIAAENGAIKKIDLPKITERLNGMTGAAGLVGVLGGALQGGETPYRKIAADFAIQNGVARFSKIDNDIDAAKLEGAGVLNLAGWTMDANGRFILSGISGAEIGAHAKGPMGSPKVSYDTKQLLSLAASMALKGKSQPATGDGTQQKPANTLKDQATKALGDLLFKKKKEPQ